MLFVFLVSYCQGMCSSVALPDCVLIMLASSPLSCSKGHMGVQPSSPSTFHQVHIIVELETSAGNQSRRTRRYSSNNCTAKQTTGGICQPRRVAELRVLSTLAQDRERRLLGCLLFKSSSPRWVRITFLRGNSSWAGPQAFCTV